MKDQHDQRHNIALNKLINDIKGLYLQTGKKVVQAGAVASMGDKEFKISTSTQYKKMFRVLFNDLQKGIESGIINGVRAEWERGEERAIDTIAKQLRGKLSLEALEKLKQDKFGATAPAYAAFKKRMENDLGLSKRIWDMSKEYERNLELLVNINSGRSAQDMAIDLQRFLNDPDHLFRRVRNAAGELEMSKAMANFKPGTGVYRSSYKNALRLARTEVNMAYRRAENARYQSLPFVTGYEVRLSNAHPVFDICDELKGKYPVDFVFSGWHPQCLCFTTAILNSKEDYEKLEQAILNGEPLPEQKHIVEMPESFNKWVERNKERAGNWKSQPYFIRDNFKGGTLDGGLKFIKTPEIVLPITPEMKGLIRAIEDITNSVNGNIELVEIPLKELNNKLELLKKEQIERFKSLSSTVQYRQAPFSVQNSLVNLMENKEYYNRLVKFEDRLNKGSLKLFAGLSEQEAYAIYKYTTRDFEIVNNYLYGKTTIKPAFLDDWMNVLNHSIDKVKSNLPTGSIDLYRGTKIGIDEINLMLDIKGDKSKYWTNKAYFSTSDDLATAKSFSENIIFHIKSDQAASIQNISAIKGETEFLFKLKKKWKVVDVIYDAENDIYKVWLEDF